MHNFCFTFYCCKYMYIDRGIDITDIYWYHNHNSRNSNDDGDGNDDYDNRNRMVEMTRKSEIWDWILYF